MPRRGIRAHYEQLPEFERGHMIELKEADWNHADWGPIVFSDESRFQLCPDDRRGRFWRNPGHRADPAFTIARHTGPQPGVIVWSAIFFTAGPLWSSLEHTYSTAVRRRHSESCFATVPLAALWRHFSAR
ncbi:transposable element Tc1 transposase [Trichonephila clavipes]|nr:transposable element Tc1 transposase [Trichonephila clavipes]